MAPQHPLQGATGDKGKRGDSDDACGWYEPWFTSSSAILAGVPNLATLCLRSVAIATVTLYVLNQKHMLPLPVGRVVSKVLFWPTIPITISRRIGKWTTAVDNAVVMGGAPFGFLSYPEKLAKQGCSGVLNMCDEYRGPVARYKRLGIEQLRLPTVDHFEPSVDDLKRAVSFIQRHEAQGGKVYVHCRAGHGRSAAAVYAWLLYKEPLADPVELNEKLVSLRNVRKTLYKQPNVKAFHRWLKDGGMMSDSDSDDEPYSPSRRQKRDRYDIIRESDAEPIGKGSGQVFSDEEDSTTEDSSDESDAYYDADYYGSEDDYEMWRRYRRDDL
ncbi:hypothetical protein ACHAXT_004275 [Thalassiosira profunda]